MSGSIEENKEDRESMGAGVSLKSNALNKILSNPSQISILSQLNSKKLGGAKPAFSLANGPIKADRIVLKSSDISFTKKN